MNAKYDRNQSQKSVKRKRKVNEINDTPKAKKYKKLMHINENDSDSLSDVSSNKTIPFYGNVEGDSTNCDLSSTDSGSRGIKKEKSYSTDKSFEISSDRIKTECIDFVMDKGSVNDNDTFCVDMSRFQNFNHTSSSNKAKFNIDSLSPNFSPKIHDISQSESKLALSKSHNSSTYSNSILSHTNKRSSSRSHIYRPHEHRKGVPVTMVPCKGPACRVQICCAQFCSQKCFKNQISPLGSDGSYKMSLYEYDGSNSFQLETVTDYGLRYPDHTYCQDHRNLYFVSDTAVDEPPYSSLVESIYYLEKEARITNPRPPPDSHGDPISATGYASRPAHTARRGRPRRSHLVGMLDPYVFHPSTELEYRPFIFREPIIEAERVAFHQMSQEPIVYAVRNCSNLYKDTRPDIPRHVLYDSSTVDCAISQYSSNNTSITNNVSSNNIDPSAVHSTSHDIIDRLCTDYKHQNSTFEDFFSNGIVDNLTNGVNVTSCVNNEDDDDDDEEDDEFSYR